PQMVQAARRLLQIKQRAVDTKTFVADYPAQLAELDSLRDRVVQDESLYRDFIFRLIIDQIVPAELTFALVQPLLRAVGEANESDKHSKESDEHSTALYEL